MNFFKEKIPARKTPDSSKKSMLEVRSKKLISKGGFYAQGGVHETEVVMKKGPRKRSVPVVIKQYEASSALKLQRISETYAQMKRDGLRVPRTLRFDAKKNRTIMTNLNRDGVVALSFNNESELIPNKSLESIPGFHRLVERLAEHAINASLKGYMLTTDCYLLLIPPTEDIDTDFVIGDLDIVHYAPFTEKETPTALLQNNMSRLNSFIGQFAMNWLKDANLAEQYIADALQITENAVAHSNHQQAA